MWLLIWEAAVCRCDELRAVARGDKTDDRRGR